MRRVVHLLIVVVIVVTVRFTGSTEARDRVDRGLRVVAEKTGVAALHERWRAQVAPAIVSVTDRTASAIRDSADAALDRAESATGSVRSGLLDQARRFTSAVASIFGGPRPGPQPTTPHQDGAPEHKPGGRDTDDQRPAGRQPGT